MDEERQELLRAEKKARSEAKRWEAIKAKAEMEASRDRMIGLALKDVDNEKKRKKITFSSDSEEEEKKERLKSKKKESTNKGDKLFDSEDEGMEEEIVFQNRHKGEKGVKLMEQEARYGNDKRFKLNEKFEESDGEMEKDEEVNEYEKELKGEKEGALSVLAKVLGKEISRDKIKKDKKRKARPFTRFDPDNAEHVKWMKENTKRRDDEGNMEEKGNDEEEDSIEEPVMQKKIAVEGRFFEMGGDFAKELKEKLEGKKADEPFSFLASIGREEQKVKMQVMQVEEKEENDNEMKSNEKKNTNYETDETDGLQGFDLNGCTGFFFDVFSLSARSVVANFRRTQTTEKVKERWTEQRDSIIKTYKNQRRFAVKNERNEKKGFEKKEGGMFKKVEEELKDNGGETKRSKMLDERNCDSKKNGVVV